MEPRSLFGMARRVAAFIKTTDRLRNHLVIEQLFRLAPVRSQYLRTRMIDRDQYAAIPGPYRRRRLLQTEIVWTDHFERGKRN